MTYYSTSLTANSIDLTTADLRLAFRLVKGFAENWATRGVDVVIPGADGQVAFPRKRDRLLIVARGFVMGSGVDEDAQRADFRDIQQTLRALMDPTQDPYTLTHVDEAGTTWTIDARPLPENPEWGDDTLPAYREAALSWVAIGADWVGVGS